MKKLNTQEQHILIESLRDKRDNYIRHRSRTDDSLAISFFSEKINNITKLVIKLCN
jgi:hypothetical protein